MNSQSQSKIVMLIFEGKTPIFEFCGKNWN